MGASLTVRSIDKIIDVQTKNESKQTDLYRNCQSETMDNTFPSCQSCSQVGLVRTGW